MRVAALSCVVLLVACGSKSAKQGATAKQSNDIPPPTPAISKATPPRAGGSKAQAPGTYSDIIIHNLILQESPNLQLKVRWIRGRMYPAKPNVYPCFDEPDSFVLDIQDGVIASSITELAAVLNSGALKGSPIRNVSLSGEGKQIQLKAILHKVIPLPVQLTGDVGASPDGSSVHIHVTKLDVLKIPVKGLLGALKIKTAELIDPKKTKGIQVRGDDIDIDPGEMLPAPRNIGKLTDVHFTNDGDLVEVYGTAKPDVTKFKQWRNFLRLRGGAITFGKLTMKNADIIIVDTSQADWFHFDLKHYQEQLVNGDIRITPQAGLEIFMPDANKIPKTKANESIGLMWMKDRKSPPPRDIP
jgi:hypothetical protein